MLDNDSGDGTAEMVGAEFPDVRLLALDENLGFAAGVNRAAEEARGEYVLLLNPDTVVHEGALDRLVGFARAHPEHGLVRRPHARPRRHASTRARAGRSRRSGASSASRPCSRRRSRARALFDPEAIGGWKRDTVREVGIVTGCLLLAPRALWRELGGFDTRFFMYGEDADLGMRAWARGLRPAITPDAVITHEIGVSSASRPDKLVLLFRGKATLLHKHWSPARRRARDRAAPARRRDSRAARALERLAGRLGRARELGRGLRAGRAAAARERGRAGGGGAVRPRRTLAYALKWAVVMNSGRRVMSTVFTFLLAALLGPHDFGVVAVALVFIAFVRMLLEQGFMTAIIQREDLDDAHLDSAFWLNLAWCVVLAIGCMFFAGWWADVNDMPQLGPVIQVLSLMIVFDGLQIVQQAVMERQLDFKRLAIRTNVSVLLGGAVGIPLALAGAGVWALVGQQLTMELALVVLIWGMTHLAPAVSLLAPARARPDRLLGQRLRRQPGRAS